MNKSLRSIDVIMTKIEKLKFLKKKLLIIATATIGVKFGGCGINLEKTINSIKIIVKLLSFENRKKIFIFIS